MKCIQCLVPCCVCLLLEAQLSNKSLLDKLKRYEEVKEENKYLDEENDEQAKNYVSIRRGCIIIIILNNINN